MITIVDFNMGNPGSIRNMLKKIGCESQLTADPARIASATKLVLPGVGAFDAGMESLERTGLIPLLTQRVRQDRVPTLGICLGMQLMTLRSAEGRRPGLGWVDAEVLRFEPVDVTLKVPHMGWNRVIQARPSVLTADLAEEPRFYFVHSYFVRCNDPADVLLTTPYGDSFHSGFQRENLYGVQFHPEKSHKFGMALLRNFATRVH
ncbi:MAG: imidazole glycerol phosphate synthase subunit HisH [Steroidobacteraceae bacterium]